MSPFVIVLLCWLLVLCGFGMGWILRTRIDYDRDDQDRKP